MEIDQDEFLFVAREPTLIQDVEKRPASLTHLFPGLVLAKDRMTFEVSLEIEGAEEDIRSLTFSVGPDSQVAGLREDHGINCLSTKQDFAFRTARGGGQDEMRTGVQEIALLELASSDGRKPGVIQ
jgi:hypothetical protein